MSTETKTETTPAVVENQAQQPEWVGIKELAKLLGCDRKSIDRQIRGGQLPGAIRMARTIRIHLPTLLRSLQVGAGPLTR